MIRIARRGSTRLEIIRVSAARFLEEGYTNTSVSSLCNEMDISPGNFTFHFPQKEMVLAVMVDELCDFQRKMMETEAQEGYSSVMSLCLELAAMASICDEDEIARDFYLSAYASDLCLGIIRENDAKRAREVFGEYCSGWEDVHFAQAEVLVSGIEEATLRCVGPEIPLEIRLAGALNAILSIYKVPPETRTLKIDRVLSMDYRALGRRVLKEFKDYVNETNEQAFVNLMNKRHFNPKSKQSADG